MHIHIFILRRQLGWITSQMFPHEGSTTPHPRLRLLRPKLVLVWWVLFVRNLHILVCNSFMAIVFCQLHPMSRLTWPKLVLVKWVLYLIFTFEHVYCSVEWFLFENYCLSFSYLSSIPLPQLRLLRVSWCWYGEFWTNMSHESHSYVTWLISIGDTTHP